MQISEDALFSTLAQINQKNKRKGAKRFIPDESVALVKKQPIPLLKLIVLS